jgi:Protein of unknown function (DUF3551)
MQKLIPVATAIVAALILTALSTPGNARSRDWCSNIRHTLNCMYDTRDQCLASVSGRSGTCVRRHR